MLEKEEILLIIYFTVIILFFIIFSIIFFVVFQKRKNKLLLEKIIAEQQFEDEIFKSRIEIQEQTLKHVSWELHDNIGQLLSTAVMQINIIGTSIDKVASESLQDVRNLVGDSLQEIRNLSKTLNHEVIQNIGIEKSIQVELTRYEKLNFLKTEFVTTGEPVELDQKEEIILYRIIQEFFSNTIKHAEASNLYVSLTYTDQNLVIVLKDDGVGFEEESVIANSGLLNMKSRAALVGANINYETAPNKGVALTLEYPLL